MKLDDWDWGGHLGASILIVFGGMLMILGLVIDLINYNNHILATIFVEIGAIIILITFILITLNLKQ